MLGGSEAYSQRNFEMIGAIWSISMYYYRSVPRIWQGGPRIFFPVLEICMAKLCALLGRFGGMPPREIFLKWCNLVRFGVYFDQILSLKISKITIFYKKKFKIAIFYIKE